jgi:hypothetical protein
MDHEKDTSTRTTGMMRAVLTDSHFWVPFLVLVAGITLLAVLHKG